MDDVTNRQELIELFKDAVQDPATMAECLSILRLYSLPASELFYKWEAYAMNHLPPAKNGIPHKFTLEYARELKKEIQREVQAKGSVGGGAAPLGAASGRGGPGLGGATVGGMGAKGRMSAGGLVPSTNKRHSGVGSLDFLDAITGSPSTPSHKKPRATASTSTSTPSLPSRLFSTTGTSTPTQQSYQSNFSNTPTHATPRANDLPTPSRFNNTPGSYASPSIAPGSTSAGVTRTVLAFKDRTNALTITDTLNPHLEMGPVPAVPWTTQQDRRIKMTSASDPVQYNYKYMFEKISTRSEVLDDRIEELTRQIRQDHEIEEDPSDPSETGEDTVFVVGMLHSDSSTVSKLTPTSLLLQASRAFGAGSRTPLRFANSVRVRGGPPNVAGAGLYVGMICGFKGKNASGGWFLVEEILLPLAPQSAMTSANEILTRSYSEKKLNGAPISIVTASGPFTVNSNLDYEPFQALAEEVASARPDVLILLGPFVDATHPLLKLGASSQTPLEIFQTQILEPLLKILESSPHMQTVLVPSVKDLVNEHVAFPQAMFSKEKFGLTKAGIHKRIIMLPNPCTFSINEVLIGVSTVDTLFHLRKEMYFQPAIEAPLGGVKGEEEEGSLTMPGGAPDLMATACRSVMNQRMFYPMYPVPSEASLDVNLDLTHLKLLEFEVIPDILILPSNLAKFAKVVDSIVVVNPSQLTKHASGGTFARLTIHPLPKALLIAAARQEEEEERDVPHLVHDRIRVDLVRI